MKFLQLTAMLVLSGFIFAQSAPEGAFSTLHVQAEDPQEYIDYLKVKLLKRLALILLEFV